jgi:hypothetical protein
MTDEATATPEVRGLLASYLEAKQARAEWEADEKRLKAELLDALGYDPEDPKPQPMDVVDDSGEAVVSVKVGTWRGMNFSYLKETYPDIYAECETSKATVSLKFPK